MYKRQGDEPRFTQPKLYKAIANHKNPRDIYAEKLISESVITHHELDQMEKEYKAQMEENLEVSRKEQNTIITPFMQDEWEGFQRVKVDGMLDPIDTSCDIKILEKAGSAITKLPKDKSFIRKIQRLTGERHKMFFETKTLDWAMGEMLAYGSLLAEGHDVRVSGQDVERGTFSHRHAVIKVEDSEEEVILLNSISEHQGQFSIYNSLLSEYGVMGFDYGYALARPKALTIWEAQFGDFSNGAQIMIDQYLSSAEDKWKLQNGLVLLLPHGYEGQGAEHSSARMERYLQLCAKDNMYVVDVTTPANLFHVLRRQVKSNFRKPLVVFTPKSLLRHPKVVSPIDEFTKGTFQTIILENEIPVKKTKTLVFCTGKFYYDLIDEREKQGRDDVAIIRLEQLFPLPKKEIENILANYNHVTDVVWAQEEPRNMGAWSHLLLHLPAAQQFRVASRRFYGTPAAGSATRFKRRHQQVLDYVFNRSKNNMR